MTKKALGKGLKAFLPEDYGILREERFIEMDVDRLKPNPHQPRINFNPQALTELAQSIKETGVLQPLIVVPENDHFKIIVGERRWRAAQLLGMKKIPVLIRTMSTEQQLEASLIENIQREELNPIEIAQAYKKLTEDLNHTQQEVAEKVGKDRTSVTNYLRLLKLPQEVQDLLAEGKISMGHAKTLISLEDGELQVSLSRQIVKKNLSVRDIERMISRLRTRTGKKQSLPPDPDLLDLQEEFLKLLGTKVSISGNQNKGVLKIYYYSLDDLNRIYEKIKGDGR